MMKKGNSELPRNEDESSLEKHIVYKLFESKSERIKARIGVKEEGYDKARHDLLSVLNILHNPKKYITDKRWMMLLCNDLSICYAALDNSYMSMGYADEAKTIIEKENPYYEKFNRKLSADNCTNMVNDKFVSCKFYGLYMITLFNRALAEKRSHSYDDAEKDFSKIIKYAEGTDLLDFNYYSTLLNLGYLYIDLGRGNEALELLDKVINKNKLDENDIRYWNAYLAKITALIDQSDYDGAEGLFEKIKTKRKDFTLYKKYRVTYTGFMGLNHYARCKIEKVMNNLRTDDKGKRKKKKDELKEVKDIIEHNIPLLVKREQKGLEIKAYKQLSDIYNIYSENEKAVKNLIKFISRGEVDDLDVFIKNDKKMRKWIGKCDDLDALETFIDRIIQVTKNKSKDICR